MNSRLAVRGLVLVIFANTDSAAILSAQFERIQTHRRVDNVQGGQMIIIRGFLHNAIARFHFIKSAAQAGQAKYVCAGVIGVLFLACIFVAPLILAIKLSLIRVLNWEVNYFLLASATMMYVVGILLMSLSPSSWRWKWAALSVQSIFGWSFMLAVIS